MIKQVNLKKIALRRYKDSETLLKNRRYDAAIYLGGYTIELLLKFNISKFFGFNRGFPESNVDLKSYNKKVVNNFNLVTNVRILKTHNLNTLVTYSGRETDILAGSYTEWIEVSKWKPEMRYSASMYFKKDAELFVKSVYAIKNILLR